MIPPISQAYQQQQLQNIQAQIANLSQMMNPQPNLNYQAPQIPAQPTPAVPQQQIQYVNGIEGARAYQLGPNSSVVLMDCNGGVFYCVSTDANGVRSPVKIGKFTLEDEPTATSNYVTKQDLADLKEEIRNLISEKTKTDNRQQFDKRGDNK